MLAYGKIICYYMSCCELRKKVSLFIEGGAIMAKCSICDKGAHFGIKVSHSHRRANKMWKSNVKAVVDGTPKKIYVCTSCLRSGKVERA